MLDYYFSLIYLENIYTFFFFMFENLDFFFLHFSFIKKYLI